MIYRITQSTVIGDEVVSTPTITTESLAQARSKLAELVEGTRRDLDAPHMRFIGGDASIYCERCAHILGGDTEVICHARIKRPLHSPTAAVVWCQPMPEGDGDA